MITAIIQARAGSMRLPGKVLKKAEGKTMLEHLIYRIKQAKFLDGIIVATTDDNADNAVAETAVRVGAQVFRGSKEDVLERYYQAASRFSVDHVVRITADCPLLDPKIVDDVVGFYLKSLDLYDYVSNVCPRTYPRGMDVEVFSFATLAKSHREAKSPAEREHVTPYIRNNPGIFRPGNVALEENLSDLRLTLDYPEDLTVISGIFKELYSNKNIFSLNDILDLYRKRPEIFSANSGFSNK